MPLRAGLPPPRFAARSSRSPPSARRPRLHSRRRLRLTNRSSGRPPARHLGREASSVIIRSAAQAPRRRRPLSSNVRRQPAQWRPCCLLRLKSCYFSARPSACHRPLVRAFERATRCAELRPWGSTSHRAAAACALRRCVPALGRLLPALVFTPAARLRLTIARADGHRQAAWAATRPVSSSAPRPKRLAGVRRSAQTLGSREPRLQLHGSQQPRLNNQVSQLNAAQERGDIKRKHCAVAEEAAAAANSQARPSSAAQERGEKDRNTSGRARGTVAASKIGT